MALPKLYEQITWVNDTTPALNEDNLNAMSQALDDIDDRVIGLAGTIMEDVPQIIEDMEILGPAVENIDENVARAEAAAESAEQYAEEIAPPIEVVKDFAEIITLEDAINKPVKDLKVKVDAVQDLHGYTKPWVGGAGKNKLPIARVPMTVGGLTFSWQSDGSVKVSGTALNEVYFWFNHEQGYADILEDNTQYIASISGIPSTLTNLEYQIAERATSTSSLTYLVSKSSDGAATFTTNSNPYCRDARLHIPNGTNLTTPIYLKMMVRLATESDATFEPYSNICPITGHSEAKVTRAGHNLIPMSIESIKSANTAGTWVGNAYSYRNHTFTVNADLSITVTSTGTASGVIIFYLYRPQTANEIKSFVGKSFILSGCETGSGSTYMMAANRVESQNGASGSVFQTTTPKTFTWRNDGSGTMPWIGIDVESGTQVPNNTVFSPMVCNPTDADAPFEPYNGEVFTIDLDGTRYGGVLDVDAGTLTLTHKITTISSFNAKSGTTGNNLYLTDVYSDIKKPSSHNVTADIISNCFGATYYNNIYGSNVAGVALTTEGKIGFGFTLSGPSSLTDANTWLSNNTLQVVYELATPQTIQLTAEEVTLLWQYNTLFADTGDLSLTYDASGVLRIANAKLDIDTFKGIVAASSDFADFKARVAAL